jgi:ribonuclease J
MIDGIYHWNWSPDDHVIFSSHIIPAEINKRQRALMEEKHKKLNVRIFKDIHVSGHSSREDLRDMINMTKPKNILPTHGEQTMMNAFNTLAQEMGYKLHKNLHPLTNGQRIKL